MITRSFTLAACSLVLGAAAGCDPSADDALDPSQTAEVAAQVAPERPADDPRGKCNINSGYAGDDACLLPPAPEEGFQIHIGPSDYNDPAEVAKFVMKPGNESSECFTINLPNDKPIYYQTAVLSGRPGTHHIINTLYSTDAKLPTGQFSVCGGDAADRLGTLPGASKPYMPRAVVAPEYAHVGSVVPVGATLQADMHYFNFTQKDILREFWLNIYYAKPEDIKETTKQIAGLGGVGWNQAPIPPGTDKVYKYECPIKGNGYILNLLGHYHAHGVRFTASVKRKSTGLSEKVFEMYDYLSPAIFQYNSVVKNPAFSDEFSGAVSGRLPVNDGDVLQWECHIINNSLVPLRYVNEVQTGEMCNMWGATVGTEAISCIRP